MIPSVLPPQHVGSADRRDCHFVPYLSLCRTPVYCSRASTPSLRTTHQPAPDHDEDPWYVALLDADMMFVAAVHPLELFDTDVSSNWKPIVGSYNLKCEPARAAELLPVHKPPVLCSMDLYRLPWVFRLSHVAAYREHFLAVIFAKLPFFFTDHADADLFNPGHNDFDESGALKASVFNEFERKRDGRDLWWQKRAGGSSGGNGEEEGGKPKSRGSVTVAGGELAGDGAINPATGKPFVDTELVDATRSVPGERTVAEQKAGCRTGFYRKMSPPRQAEECAEGGGQSARLGEYRYCSRDGGLATSDDLVTSKGFCFRASWQTRETSPGGAGATEIVQHEFETLLLRNRTQAVFPAFYSQFAEAQFAEEPHSSQRPRRGHKNRRPPAALVPGSLRFQNQAFTLATALQTFFRCNPRLQKEIRCVNDVASPGQIFNYLWYAKRSAYSWYIRDDMPDDW